MTKKIHLVLVTSLLTACSRMIIPSQQSPPGNTVDSTSAPEDSTNNYYYYYPPSRIHRRQAFWRNYRLVVKGGFGRAAASTAS